MGTFDDLLETEIGRSRRKHKTLRNHDEALSVLLEEVHEARMEVYKKQRSMRREDLLAELVQVAACAVRWLDLIPLPERHRRVAGTLPPRDPAGSHHEGMTRLDRAVDPLRPLVLLAPPAPGGPSGVDLSRLTHHLLDVMDACADWARDMGLVATCSPEVEPSEATASVQPSQFHLPDSEPTAA